VWEQVKGQAIRWILVFASNASVCYVSLVWLVSSLLLQLQSHDHATVFDALVRMSLATSVEAKSRFGA
jgi:hypothetical protein